jgi:hypothetical protein
MTVATAEISESLQVLIDCRLDTIDRMLLGRLPRQDRLDIGREVESQIHELLRDHNPDELTRDDVLAVLARLDPPEAYIPDETESPATPARTRFRSRSITSVSRSDGKAARVSGILGLAALALVLIYPAPFMFAAFGLGSIELVWLLCALTLAFAFPASILGLVLGVYARKGGAWAVVGIAGCVLSLLLSPLIVVSCFL